MYRRRYGDVKNLIVQGIKTIVECIIFTSDSYRVTILTHCSLFYSTGEKFSKVFLNGWLRHES